MIDALSFDDVLIVPTFSEVTSRKNVSTTTSIGNLSLDLPIISANMDTVTGSEMANAMGEMGAGACLHRFSSIEENVKQYKNSPEQTMVSIGVGDLEYERALALYNAGARNFVIDVAHGASENVVKQYVKIRNSFNDDVTIIVGNFATAESIKAFESRIKTKKPDAYKVGIGGGSLCTTRIVTGCGLPTLHSVMDCASGGYTIIADGGIRNSGDIVKALAAGASAVMVGGVLSGAHETPGELVALSDAYGGGFYKKYRGSASLESYKVQNKEAKHRAPEGEATSVPYKGPVSSILQPLAAGIYSGMSYVGATNLTELRENANFVRVTDSGKKESQPHAKV